MANETSTASKTRSEDVIEYLDAQGNPRTRKLRQKAGFGYTRMYQPGHPRANPRGYVLEHILVAERALGRLLPDGVEVHHVDHDRRNNDPTNLVICQDVQYHKLLHYRERALRATGNPNARRCSLCDSWDESGGPMARRARKWVHRVCRNAQQRAYRAKRRVSA